MFGYNNKITLTGINAINKEGKLIDYRIKFPFNNSNVYVPNDIVQISIFEYHEHESVAYEAFKIYVGKITTISEICQREEHNIKFINNTLVNINSIDDKLCYYDDENGKHIIFAKINDGDVLV